jgi:hypothetical protein
MQDKGITVDRVFSSIADGIRYDTAEKEMPRDRTYHRTYCVHESGDVEIDCRTVNCNTQFGC